jgi:hypothetical protein
MGEIGMNFKDYEYGLMELFQGVQCVPGTFPPVYMIDSMLISYDKMGRLQIIDASPVQPGPVKQPGNLLSKLIKSVVCL